MHKKYLTTKVVNVGRQDAAKFGAHGIPGKLAIGHLPIGTELTLEQGGEQERQLLAADAIRPATQEVYEDIKDKGRPPLKDIELDTLPDMTVAQLQEFAEKKDIPLTAKKKDEILKEIYAAYDIEVEKT